MLLRSPKARLITFFKTRLTKIYFNSQLKTDPIYPSKNRRQCLFVCSNVQPFTTLCLQNLGEKSYEKNCGKRRNAGTQQFILFVQCYLPSANEFNFDVAKCVSPGKSFEYHRS